MIKSFKKNKNQDGQALVETALTLPLLIMMLMGVGYFGSAVTAMHNLSVAARYSARAVAMDSTKNMMDRTEGGYFLRLSSSTFKDFALKSLPGFKADRLEATPLSTSQIAFLATSVKKGKLIPIPESKGFAFVYKMTGRADEVSTNLSNNVVDQLRGFDVGVGNIFYAVKLRYHLKEIDWISKYLFKKEGLKIEAVSVMPAELPLRNTTGIVGSDYGLMNLNKGFFKIITTNIRDDSVAKNNQYEDLVK